MLTYANDQPDRVRTNPNSLLLFTLLITSNSSCTQNVPDVLLWAVLQHECTKSRLSCDSDNEADLSSPKNVLRQQTQPKVCAWQVCGVHDVCPESFMRLPPAQNKNILGEPSICPGLRKVHMNFPHSGAQDYCAHIGAISGVPDLHVLHHN